MQNLNSDNKKFSFGNYFIMNYLESIDEIDRISFLLNFPMYIILSKIHLVFMETNTIGRLISQGLYPFTTPTFARFYLEVSAGGLLKPLVLSKKKIEKNIIVDVLLSLKSIQQFNGSTDMLRLNLAAINLKKDLITEPENKFYRKFIMKIKNK